MRSDPDRKLLEQWRQGRLEERRAAFEQLYERYSLKVFNTALNVTGDEAAAADVTQDTFLQVFEKLGEFESRSKFSSWLYRIAVNFAVERRRKDRRLPASLPSHEINDDDAESEVPDVRLPEQFDKLSGDESVALTRRALASLSPKLRVVLVLRFIDELGYEEMAEVLGCSVGTVKSRINRARDALARLLAPEPGETMGGRTGSES